MKLPRLGRPWQNRLFLVLALLGSGLLVAVLVLGFIAASELSGAAGESYAAYRWNVVDQAAALNRLIFATARVVDWRPLPGESPGDGTARRLSSCKGILSHAQFLPKLDEGFVRELLAEDPLLLDERLKASDLDLEKRLARIRVLVGTTSALVAAGSPELGASFDAIREEARSLMIALESRSSLLVQLGDYFYDSSRKRLEHILSHSNQLGILELLAASSLALAIGLYLRSLIRTQAELRLHKAHLDELVAQRTGELSLANARLVEEAAVRERAQRDLERALAEREDLLKEVYHRVKNNLGMINGLISLQMDEAPPAAAAAFEDLQNRIVAISTIHERLYRARDLTHVDLGEYLGELLSGLVGVFRKDPDSVAVEIDAPDISLPAAILITLGLMATEIATNSLKHGLKDRERGRISLRAREEGAALILEIRDDGEAPADPAVILESHTLGNRLVRSLCEQLRGSMELRVGGGVAYRFEFPLPEPAGHAG